MKEIKFRAWDKITKKMYDVGSILFETHVVKIALYCDEPNQHPATWYRGYDEIELMQYTGIKDSFNSEIYEGDILSFGDGRFVSDVVFEFNEWSVKARVGHPNATTKELSSFNMYNWTDYTIIGNIYENSELFKEQEK